MDRFTPGECYQTCNKKYSALDPGRLFCKKGCDSEEETLEGCRVDHCNKLCIKQEQGDQKLWFKFLYRASGDSVICLESCIYGCTARTPE